MHRSLPAQQTSLGRRSGPHVHRASKTKPTPAPGGEGSAARLTEGSGHCDQPSPRLGSRRVPLLQPCAPSSARQPWIHIPGAVHLGCRRRCLSGALQDPPVGVSPLPEILCHFPTGHFPSGPPSTGPGLSSHQSPPSAVISIPHPHCSSSITHPPPPPTQGGVGAQTQLPWHLHVATAGPNRVVQHLQAHRTVERRDGQLGVPPALQGPRGGRGGRGFPAIAAQHGAHPCASCPRRSPRARCLRPACFVVLRWRKEVPAQLRSPPPRAHSLRSRGAASVAAPSLGLGQAECAAAFGVNLPPLAARV